MKQLDFDHATIANVEAVLKLLGAVAKGFVLVGGCAAGILVTNASRRNVRATLDVDFVVPEMRQLDHAELESKLRAVGFVNDRTVRCRFRAGDYIIDIMPVNSTGSDVNRWYGQAQRQPEHYVTKNGAQLSVISAPLFIATKLEAFHGRGNCDFNASHDIEDIIAVIDGRSELPVELDHCNLELRDYLEEEFEQLLTTGDFVESVANHLPGDASQILRVEQAFAVMRTIAKIA